MQENIILQVNNKNFKFWNKIEINRSINNLAHNFSFNSFIDINNIDIPEIDSICKIYYNDILVTNGRIDATNIDVNKSGFVFSVNGRSLTAELIDCSINENFINLTGDKIIKRINNKFNIKTIVKKKLAMEGMCVFNNETAYNKILELAKKNNVSIFCDHKSNIIITENTENKKRFLPIVLEEKKILLIIVIKSQQNFYFIIIKLLIIMIIKQIK